ncbi:glycosyltransferase family 9 protein [Acetomicrobium sp.]|uniref:glycosyltransferase family 9 protein n=1 Tax=Acetomicrobium sp. TaxID=1872099 RepID=UPI002FC65FD8
MPSEDLTEVLGRPVRVGEGRIYYQVSGKLRLFARNLLGGTPKPRVACIIGASKPVKRWPACSWAEFVSMIASSGGSAVLLGHGRQETDMAKEIISLLPEAFKEKTVDLVGKLKLDEMAAVIEACGLVIGGDTGPMHLALALHKPSVGLFGPTLPGQVGLDKINIKLLSGCKCAGCQNWDCDKNCLSSIKPKEAFEALAKLHEFSRNQMIK